MAADRIREQETIRRILASARRIAVVGLSDRPQRESFGVALSLHRRGYEILPVNPNLDGWEGLPSYATLAEVPGPIDMVDVFRREEHLVDVTRQAVAVGARSLWLQEGLRSAEARRIAEEAGLDVVEDRCLAVLVAMHAGELELPPSAA